MDPKKETPLLPLIAVALVLGLLFGAWWVTQPPPEPLLVQNPTPVQQPKTTLPAPTPISSDPRITRNLARATESPKTAKEMLARIQAILEILKTGTPEEKKAALKKLEEELWSMPHLEAIFAIRDFLKTGEDAQTGIEFEIGEKGILEGSPTLRVFLLDQIGSLGLASGSKIPLDIAREILNGPKNSADEWALSMRNSTWQDPSNTALIAQKTREMLTYPAWQTDPSSGFLESFDGIVYSKDVSMLPTLSNFLTMDNTQLEQASLVAADRVAEVAPLETMNFLNANPSLFADRPMLRVDYYTAADLSNPGHRQAVEAFLNRQDVSFQEKTKLLGGLTMPGSFASDNLFTETVKPPTLKQERERAQTLSVVGQQWLESGKYPELEGPLKEFVEQNKENSTGN